jgi:hypothetical protein
MNQRTIQAWTKLIRFTSLPTKTQERDEDWSGTTYHGCARHQLDFNDCKNTTKERNARMDKSWDARQGKQRQEAHRGGFSLPLGETQVNERSEESLWKGDNPTSFYVITCRFKSRCVRILALGAHEVFRGKSGFKEIDLRFIHVKPNLGWGCFCMTWV